jgi:hypothetical protein
MSIRSLFTRRCTVERAAPATAGDGTVSLSWSTVATGAPCALQPRAAETGLRTAGEALTAEALLFLPAGTDIRPRLADGQADRVTVDGTVYRVAAVEDNAAGTEAFRVAALVREIA